MLHINRDINKNKVSGCSQQMFSSLYATFGYGFAISIPSRISGICIAYLVRL